jgi:hypothetical protein
MTIAKPLFLLPLLLAIFLFAAPSASAQNWYCKNHPNSEGCRGARAIGTAGRQLGRGVSKTLKKIVRYYKNDKCDEVGKKEGEKAKRRCEEAERTGSDGATPTLKHYAAAEVDCYKRGRPDRYGIQEIRVWSAISREAARKAVADQMNTHKVCATEGHDPTLRDGDWRWLTSLARPPSQTRR